MSPAMADWAHGSRQASIVGLDQDKVDRMANANPHVADLAHDASKATDAERHMSLWQSLKLYPKAVGWSVLLSGCIIMEGFDIVLIANLLALPAFQQAFGEPTAAGGKEISAAWQTGLTNGAYAGEIIGLMFTGWVADRVGYRKTMIAALAAITGLIFIVFFVQSLPQLVTGLVLMGIPWGVFQSLSTTYAAEVCPVPLRPYLTTYINLCWVIGQLLASGVLKGVSDRTDEWGYRIPYALQWIWPVPLMVGIYLAPESPWWLVRKERYEDAKLSLRRLTSRNTPSFNPDETISMMIHTNEIEKATNEGTSYWDCFKGVDLRRTEIVAVVWLIQSWCGSTFMGFSTYFFQQAGLDDSASFSLSLGQYGLGAVGVFVAWFAMQWFGRRTLYCAGLAIQTAILLVIGFLGLISKDNTSAQWAIGAMLLIFTFVYDSTVGPVCYCLVAEIPSTRLRQKSVVLARNLYNLGSIVGNILTPRMLNSNAWNWGAKSSFFWAGACFLCFVWTFFRLPEPKGRTYGELDMLFEQHIGARAFARTEVDLAVYSGHSAEKHQKSEFVTRVEKI